ncbi:MAG: PD-(D/E)XK nuclease family protein [Flavobacteriales bacterium]|nr:PD-(D/E)XK nuclease family protein [Flavobacteriales bacterium]
MKFLEQLAQHIYANHPNPKGVCIVSPNKRAGVFLRKHLSDLYKKPVFSPTILGIEDFFVQLSELHIADTFEQLFIFYRVHLDIEKNNAETIDLFASWATTLLNDFNELDQYLIDSDHFFTSLNADRALEVWSPEQEELTPFQKQYLKFWEKLPFYYTRFKEELSKQKKAYTGMAFRMVAENIENEEWRNQKLNAYEKIYFAGFNALTTSEEKVLNTLLKTEKAHVFWDADLYYLNDVHHEAGAFLRKHILKYNPNRSTVFYGNLETDKKVITIYGITGNISQTKLAASLIDTIKPNEYNDTALVLANESLLIPLLDSLPENINKVNITMGYPLKNTGTASFFQALIRLHLNKQKFSAHQKNRGFYYKDLLALLKHPYFAKLYPNEKIETEKYILKNNKVFFNSSDWSKANPHTPQPHFLEPTETPIDFIRESVLLIENIKKHFSENAIENEHLFYFLNLFHKLSALIQSYHFIETLNVFQQFFTRFLQTETLPFFGEPLEGVQIMGVLETRTLDFQNVIVLSLNEGNLPASKQINSIIPFAIKRNFGLPVYKEKDAIFSYHFYRLLQRTKNIHLIYNSDHLSFAGAEKSRFITQIEEELPAKNNSVNIKKLIVNIPFSTGLYNNQPIQNNEFALNRIKEIFTSGISATHLNTYINCKQDFYNKYILGLSEENTVEENIEDHTIGTILHKTLEKLYLPYIGKEISSEDLTQMQKKIEKNLQETIEENYSKEYFLSGKNFLALEICRKYLQKLIGITQNDFSVNKKKMAIISLEQKLTFNTQLNTLPFPILFKGTIDKIESDKTTTYIIDYKSGKVENKNLTFESIKELFTEKEKSKALQLFFYNWLYYKQHSHSNATAAIISLRNPSNLMMLNNSTPITAENFNEFEFYLAQLILELTDINTTFTHNPESNYCIMC